jgi:FecR protein
MKHHDRGKSACEEGTLRLNLARSIAFAAALALIESASPVHVLAAAKVGVASAVKNDVQGAGQPLSPGSQLFEQEVVKTGVASVAQLLFLDQTSLTIGPKAQVKLDKFVFDPNKKVGDVVLSATKGAFRFVSGVQDPHSYTINTPVATIGTRGTIFSGYNFAGGIIIIVEEGSVIIGGIVVKAGQALVVYKGGGHDGPFTPDGSFFDVEGKISLPLFGHDLGPFIDKIVGGDSIGSIVDEIKSQEVPGPMEDHEPPPCEDCG